MWDSTASPQPQPESGKGRSPVEDTLTTSITYKSHLFALNDYKQVALAYYIMEAPERLISSPNKQAFLRICCSYSAFGVKNAIIYLPQQDHSHLDKADNGQFMLLR